MEFDTATIGHDVDGRSIGGHEYCIRTTHAIETRLSSYSIVVSCNRGLTVPLIANDSCFTRPWT